MPGQVFSLADVYNQVDQARAAGDRHVAAEQDNEAQARQLADDALYRDSVKEALDEHGDYSPEMHAKALEKRGRGDLGHKLRQDLAADSQKVIDWVNSVVPYVNEQTYPQIRAIAAQNGFELPEKYNKEEFDQIAATAVARAKEHIQYGAPEQIPGAEKGVVGQKRLDTGEYRVLDSTVGYGRGGYGAKDSRTALMKNVEYLAEQFKVSPEEAYGLMNMSKTKRPEDFYKELAKAYVNQYETPEQANKKAAQITTYLYGPGWEAGVSGRTEPAAPPQRPNNDPLGIRGTRRAQPPP